MYIFAAIHVMGPVTFFREAGALWIPLLHNIGEAALVFASPYYIWVCTPGYGYGTKGDTPKADCVDGWRWIVELPVMVFNGAAMAFTIIFALYGLSKFVGQICTNLWGGGFYVYYYCFFCAKKRDTLATQRRDKTAAFPESPNDRFDEITVVVGVPKELKAFELGETVVCPKCRTEQMAVLPGYVECTVCRVRPYKRGTKVSATA
jgi:hypothetical protein